MKKKSTNTIVIAAAAGILASVPTGALAGPCVPAFTVFHAPAAGLDVDYGSYYDRIAKNSAATPAATTYAGAPITGAPRFTSDLPVEASDPFLRALAARPTLGKTGSFADPLGLLEPPKSFGSGLGLLRAETAPAPGTHGTPTGYEFSGITHFNADSGADAAASAGDYAHHEGRAPASGGAGGFHHHNSGGFYGSPYGGSTSPVNVVPNTAGTSTSTGGSHGSSTTGSSPSSSAPALSTGSSPGSSAASYQGAFANACKWTKSVW